MSKKQVTSGTKAKKTIVNIIIHIFLAILSFIWVLPIFWVVLTSFRGEDDKTVAQVQQRQRSGSTYHMVARTTLQQLVNNLPDEFDREKE